MVFFNYSTMQMAAKVVYYGPGLCGKTTNLQWIFEHTSTESRGEMVSLATETDRTLFFDLLPIDVGSIAGFSTRIQLYTVPGQVFYNTTRKLVLKGVDGVVFVADSQRPMLQANIESFQNLEENLAEMGLSLDNIPVALQYNKRDLPNICTREELDQALNRQEWPAIEASALNGDGVFETLKMISKATLLALKKRLTKSRPEGSGAATGSRPVTPVARPPRPAPGRTAPGRPAQAQRPSPPPASVKTAPAPPPSEPERSEPEPLEPPPMEATDDVDTDEAPAVALREALADLDSEQPEDESSPVEKPDEEEPPPVALDEEEPETAGEEAAVEEPEPEPEPVAAKGAPPVEEETPEDTPAAPAPEPAPAPRRRRKRARAGGFDALEELEKLRRQTVAPAVAAAENGKREINRDVRMTLKRDDFSRAHRVSLTLQVEDAQRQAVDEARQVHVDIENAGSLEELLLRLNIELNASA